MPQELSRQVMNRFNWNLLPISGVPGRYVDSIRRADMTVNARLLTMVPFLFILVACSSSTAKNTSAENSCPFIKAMWAKPPEDPAVPDPPAYGYYFMNQDRSIWASAWWTESEEYSLRAGEEGNKIGWFRPAGAKLVITGQRLDAKAPPLEAEASCCYPTRFQASDLYFPTEGCWEVTARAEDRELSFVVWVEP
jgi:hypothetical protein